MNTELLKGLPTDQGEPVFDEPWQARSFAMAVQLHESGLFTWNEWAETLSQCIASQEKSAAISSGSDYYTQWQTALEILVDQKTAGR